MNRYRKLAKDSVLFFVANFGSKLVSFLIVPYYTYALNTTQYGTVDVIVSTVGMIGPLVTLGLNDVITLYLVQKRASLQTTLFVSFSLLLFGNIVLLAMLPVFNIFQVLKPYLLQFYILIIVQSFYGMLQSCTRGLNKLGVFAISGIGYTVILVCSNLVLLTYLDTGVTGYLLSMILAYTICDIYLLLSIKLVSNLFGGRFDKSLVKEMLKLSIPLLPNAILWWLMNICDKYSILYFIGPDGNGLYTVANKLPTILTTAYAIIQQAWQLTSMEMQNKAERSKMSSQLFSILLFAMTFGTLILSTCSKFIIATFCERSYFEAWSIVPILLISATFNSLSSFFGTNYILMGDTFAALKVTIVGTVINAMGNMIMVPVFGLKGAAIATSIGFIFMALKKMYDTRDFTPITTEKKQIILTFLFLIIGAIIPLLDIGVIGILSECVILTCISILYINEINIIFNRIIKYLKKGVIE